MSRKVTFACHSGTFRVSSKVPRTLLSGNQNIHIPGHHIQNGRHVPNRGVRSCSRKSTIHSKIFTDTQNFQGQKMFFTKFYTRYHQAWTSERLNFERSYSLVPKPRKFPQILENLCEHCSNCHVSHMNFLII